MHISYIAYTHKYTYMYIHTRRYTTLEPPFGSNSLYVVYRNTKRFPLQMKNSFLPLPLPSAFFCYSFILDNHFYFLFFFFLTNRGIRARWAQSAPRQEWFCHLSLTTSRRYLFRHRVFDPILPVFIREISFARDTIASLLANFRENDHGICVYRSLQALG